MSETPGATPSGPAESGAVRLVERVGSYADRKLHRGSSLIKSLGGMTYLLGDALVWTGRGLFKRGMRIGRVAVRDQMIRVGVDSIGIVVLVQMFIGCILALQLAPVLGGYGQLEQVAVVVAIAVVRELGPLITAIVLSGFAGASIAAEVGAMVESEEIKALRAHALNPIQFLIVPRFLATSVMIVGLSVIADVVGVLGGLLTSWGVLDIPAHVYIDMTQEALVVKDFVTGLVKAFVFGVLISMIACYHGLNVSGGAVGVGRATTRTVVQCIVAIIGTDALFTTVFYVFEL